MKVKDTRGEKAPKSFGANGVRTLKKGKIIGGSELTFGLRAREYVVHLVGGIDPVSIRSACCFPFNSPFVKVQLTKGGSVKRRKRRHGSFGNEEAWVGFRGCVLCGMEWKVEV